MPHHAAFCVNTHNVMHVYVVMIATFELLPLATYSIILLYVQNGTTKVVMSDVHHGSSLSGQCRCICSTHYCTWFIEYIVVMK